MGTQAAHGTLLASSRPWLQRDEPPSTPAHPRAHMRACAHAWPPPGSACQQTANRQRKHKHPAQAATAQACAQSRALRSTVTTVEQVRRALALRHISEYRDQRRSTLQPCSSSRMTHEAGRGQAHPLASDCCCTRQETQGGGGDTTAARRSRSSKMCSALLVGSTTCVLGRALARWPKPCRGLVEWAWMDVYTIKLQQSKALREPCR